MHRATPLDSSFRGYVSGGSRGCTLEAKDEKMMQEIKANFMKHEQRDKIEHPQNYGFTSYIRKAKIKGGEEGEEEIEDCAEHFTQFMGGNRAFPVCEILDDRRYRIRNFKEGEVAIYDDQQQKLHIQRERIYGRSQYKVEFRVIKDEPKEDGHGKDQEADRDQELDQSKRLSTIVMDKDTIISERTNEKGEKLSQILMTDKRVALTTYKDGKAHLVFDLDEETSLITMQTIKNDRPNMSFTIDEEAGETRFQGSPDLILEMDDDEKKITIRTEKNEKPHLVFELDEKNNKIKLKTEQDQKERLVLEMDDEAEKITLRTNEKTAMVLDNKLGKVRIGDLNASTPAAMRGTIDSYGCADIIKLAKKVLVT